MSGPLNQQVGDDSSLAATIKFALHNFSMTQESCLPAVVVSYDHVKNLAVVRPLIMMTLRTAVGGVETRKRQSIPDVPVLSLGAGKFHIHFPVSEGDLGWLVASDRDISGFMESLKDNPATTQRFHSLADGIFIPDMFRNYSLQQEDVGAMVIQSTDGNTRVSIRSDNIKVTTTSNVTLDCPETHITGHVTVDGDAEIGGISFLSHVHGGVIPGGGNTLIPK